MRSSYNVFSNIDGVTSPLFPPINRFVKLAAFATCIFALNGIFRFPPMFENDQVGNIRRLDGGKKGGLNILTLGGSVTWGANLERRQDAYPFILGASNHVENLAIRASGADFPSRCIESMTRDTKFDVIILEFSINGLEGFHILLRRIRSRYPDAIIIYIHLYGLKGKSDAVDAESEKLGLFSPDSKYVWGKMRPHHENLYARMEKILKSFGGYSYKFPYFPSPKDAVPFFLPDGVHLNEAGHEMVANVIKTIIDKSSYSQETSRLGSWGRGDNCFSWFATGKMPLKYSGDASMGAFATSKHALGIYGKASIIVHNPRHYYVPVYVNYMTHGTMYPVTKFQLGRKIKMIDPKGSDVIHITKSTQVGWAKPGRNNLIIENNADLANRFRLTGVILCGECIDLDNELERIDE